MNLKIEDLRKKAKKIDKDFKIDFAKKIIYKGNYYTNTYVLIDNGLSGDKVIYVGNATEIDLKLDDISEMNYNNSLSGIDLM